MRIITRYQFECPFPNQFECVPFKNCFYAINSRKSIPGNKNLIYQPCFLCYNEIAYTIHHLKYYFKQNAIGLKVGGFYE